MQWLRTVKLTNFVKLEELVLGVELIQSLLGLLAVRAVWLGEDNYEGSLAGVQRGAQNRDNVPTELLSMSCWTLVDAWVIVPGLVARVKNDLKKFIEESGRLWCRRRESGGEVFILRQIEVDLAVLGCNAGLWKASLLCHGRFWVELTRQPWKMRWCNELGFRD